MSATCVGQDHVKHGTYAMSCADFARLTARAGGICELCIEPTEALAVDHDHSVSAWAVRGLVCSRCNSHLRHYDNGDWEITDSVQRYLDNAWHLANPQTRRRKRAPMAARMIRCTDAEWAAITAASEARGEWVSEATRRLWAEYVKEVRDQQ